MPWVKRLALPASASTAASLAITSSAFLASGAQVCETVAIGPDTPVVLPTLLISPAMSESTSALVALNAVKASRSHSNAPRPWFARRCELSCRFEAEVLDPHSRAPRSDERRVGQECGETCKN